MKTRLKFSIVLKSETVTYYINDIAGSPVAAMDQSGSLLWRESYNPFGESRKNPSKNENDVGFTGHQKDDSTGLTYMQARYYDPVIGRFYSNDPIAYTSSNPVMSFNRYLYVNNNPYKYNDPDGKFLNFAIGAVIGIVAEVVVQTVVQGKSIGNIDMGAVGKAGLIGAWSGSLIFSFAQ